MLKKNDIALERDSLQENIYYISFTYTSLYNFNLHIFFNACENKSELENEHNVKYKPNLRLETLVINIENVFSGKNERFLDQQAKVDLMMFNNEKIFDKEYHDMIIECVVMKNEKVECILSTFCKIIKVKENGYKVKTDLQKINVRGVWFEMHDIYGLEETNVNSNECEACYTNKKNTIFLPCMHSYACNDCAVNVRIRGNKCPLCRKKITDTILIDEKTDECENKEEQK